VIRTERTATLQHENDLAGQAGALRSDRLTRIDGSRIVALHTFASVVRIALKRCMHELSPRTGSSSLLLGWHPPVGMAIMARAQALAADALH
jgi:hypothetical protein